MAYLLFSSKKRRRVKKPVCNGPKNSPLPRRKTRTNFYPPPPSRVFYSLVSFDGRRFGADIKKSEMFVGKLRSLFVGGQVGWCGVVCATTWSRGARVAVASWLVAAGEPGSHESASQAKGLHTKEGKSLNRKERQKGYSISTKQVHQRPGQRRHRSLINFLVNEKRHRRRQQETGRPNLHHLHSAQVENMQKQVGVWVWV